MMWNVDPQKALFEVGFGMVILSIVITLALLLVAPRQTDEEAACEEWWCGEPCERLGDAYLVAHDPRTGKPFVLPPNSANSSVMANKAGLDAMGYPDVTPGTLVEIDGCVFTFGEVEALERVRARQKAVRHDW